LDLLRDFAEVELMNASEARSWRFSEASFEQLSQQIFQTIVTFKVTDQAFAQLENTQSQREPAMNFDLTATDRSRSVELT